MKRTYISFKTVIFDSIYDQGLKERIKRQL